MRNESTGYAAEAIIGQHFSKFYTVFVSHFDDPPIRDEEDAWSACLKVTSAITDRKKLMNELQRNASALMLNWKPSAIRFPRTIAPSGLRALEGFANAIARAFKQRLLSA